MVDEKRLEFLGRYFDTAREELLWRARHRDTWLAVHLLTQVGIFALASGFEFSGIQSPPRPEMLALAYPTSLLFACLYAVEDRLIVLLSNYCGEVSRAEQALCSGPTIINWDISDQLRLYARGGTLHLRLLAQVVSFVVLPGVLVVFQSANGNAGGFDATPSWYMALGWALATSIVLVLSFELRARTGDVGTMPVLSSGALPVAETKQRTASVVRVLRYVRQAFRRIKPKNAPPNGGEVTPNPSLQRTPPG
jgi:hypothetical protein